MLHFHHIRMFHPKNYQNYFYHYYFYHFLPLLLNSERKSGKDLEMTGNALSFVFFGIISCYFVKNGVYLQK